MEFIICFALAVISLIITSILIFFKRKHRVYYAIGGVYMALVFMFFPAESGKGIIEITTNVFTTLIRSIKVFGLNEDFFTDVFFFGALPTWFIKTYLLLMTVLYIISPMLTFGFFLSLFDDIKKRIKVYLSYKKEVYVFSALNERSALLANSISDKNPNAFFVFFRADKKDDFESDLDKLHCSLFNENIASVSKKLLLKSPKLSVYIMDDNESVNLSDAIAFINKCKKNSVYSRKNAIDLFVLTSSHEAELVLNSMDKKGIKLRRINENTAFAYRLLYENPVFNYADNNGKINISLLGFSGFCEEMMKALIWNSQRDGYNLNLNIFTEKVTIESFLGKYPELLDTDKLSDADEINYKVFLHDTVDFQNLPDTSLAFVDMENDKDTLRTAVNLYEKFSAVGANPKINAVLKNSIEEKTKLQNHKGQIYNISFISKNILYSENKLIDGDLEKLAMKLFDPWNEKQDEKRKTDFYSFDFNYRSSLASALFWSIRHKQNQSLEVNEANMKLEHKRWNAFMRTEGYKYSETRNDIAKLHPCLVAWNMLSEEMQSYDANPIKVADKEFKEAEIS